MFGIGQFAQLAKVSVRTLRHYDQIGLFQPASVDEWSGYRSYRASQLGELNRILALEVYLDVGPDRSSWVTELQFALASESAR